MKREGSTRGVNLEHRKAFPHWIFFQEISEYIRSLSFCMKAQQNLISVFVSALQVIDFGSSCYEHQRVYTYIQSRFYRAPEVILGARYGMPIDMWSLGCILAELLTGYPLLPGEDEGDQLSCIIELLGMPPQKLLDQSKRAKNFISSKGKYLQSSQIVATSCPVHFT